ncbi:MAG: YqgE/AlgH family protein [Pseudomonadota bacterium]
MTEPSPQDDANFLDGRMLIAMPGMSDPRFVRSIVYLCAHSEDGAMGLITNKAVEDLLWKDLFKKINIPIGSVNAPRQICFGGPVDMERGFLLHSSDYFADGATLKVDDETSMTATIEILQDIAMGRGPDQTMLALGYAGWSAGQLESELQQNGWLLCDPDLSLLFGEDHDEKWDRALAKLGINPAMLGSGGHA